LIGQIYYGATTTIMAATTPRNTADTELAPEGFLHRAPGDLPSVKMQYYSEDGTPSGEWLLRPLGTLVSTHWDLFTRGWVVQEHILSRRKIIFSPNELYWVRIISQILKTIN
jgi:hypothetical protein